MKMEPVPWIKDYEVDMDELYCELTLEKLENELSGVKGQQLKGYQELFDEYSKCEKRLKNLKVVQKGNWQTKVFE